MRRMRLSSGGVVLLFVLVDSSRAFARGGSGIRIDEANVQDSR
jgi:hypothetical protein